MIAAEVVAAAASTQTAPITRPPLPEDKVTFVLLVEPTMALLAFVSVVLLVVPLQLK